MNSSTSCHKCMTSLKLLTPTHLTVEDFSDVDYEVFLEQKIFDCCMVRALRAILLDEFTFLVPVLINCCPPLPTTDVSMIALLPIIFETFPPCSLMFGNYYFASNNLRGTACGCAAWGNMDRKLHSWVFNSHPGAYFFLMTRPLYVISLTYFVCFFYIMV